MAEYVFVSYSRHDKHYVDRLVTYLRDHGFDVWYDEQIATAERWRTVIRDRVDGCGVFLVVMTPASEESRYVEWEYLRAMESDRPVVPLLLAGNPFMELSGYQHYRVSNQELPDVDLIDTIKALLPVGTSTPRRAVAGSEVWHTPDAAAVVACSPQGDVVAVGYHNTVHIHDARTGRSPIVLRRTIQPPEAGINLLWAGRPPTPRRHITALAWSRDDGRLGVVWEGTYVVYQNRMWRKRGVAEVGVWSLDGKHVSVHQCRAIWRARQEPHAAWSSTGRKLAIHEGGSRLCRIYDLDLATLNATPRRITVRNTSGQLWPIRMAWSPDGRRLAASFGVNTDPFMGYRAVAVWDVETGAQMYMMSGAALAIAWAPGGNYLAGADNGVVRLWHVETGKQVYSLSGHTQKINALAYSPDGQYLATGGDDQTVRIWRPTTGESACLLIGHTASVTSLSWAPDSSALVSGGADGARMWRLASS